MQVAEMTNYGLPVANFGEGLGFGPGDFDTLPPNVVAVFGSMSHNQDILFPPEDTGFRNVPGQHASISSAPSSPFAMNPASQPPFAPSFSMASMAPDLYAPAAPAPVSFAGQNGMMGSPVTAGFASEPRNMSPVTTVFPHASTLTSVALPPGQQRQHSETFYATESPDVLEAATALHSGAHGRSHSFHGVSNDATPRSYQSQRRGMAPPPLQLRYQEIDEFKQEGRRLSQSQTMQEGSQAGIYNAMFFGQGHSGQAAGRVHNGAALVNPPVLQYGTDHNFSDTSRPFVAKHQMDRFEVMEEDQQRYVDGALAVSTSNDTTRAPSPSLATDALKGLKTRVPPKPIKTDIPISGNSRKRSAASAHDERDLAEDLDLRSAVMRTSGRGRKLKGSEKESPEVAVGSAGSKAKRKKTAATKRKENLTEAEKRANHINSEKKRRTVIQQGFDNLHKLLPISEGSKPSKSAVLTMTVSYLEGLLNGNVQLEKQLAQLEGRQPQLLGWQDQLLAEQKQREQESQRQKQP